MESPGRSCEDDSGEAIHSAEEISQERLFTLISVLIALTGISIGWLFPAAASATYAAPTREKYYVDEVYDARLSNPFWLVHAKGYGDL